MILFSELEQKLTSYEDEQDAPSPTPAVPVRMPKP